jgi:hypothetical protein
MAQSLKNCTQILKLEFWKEFFGLNDVDINQWSNLEIS